MANGISFLPLHCYFPGEKLAEEWDGHDVGLIAQVDCSSRMGRPLCDEMNINEFPTLLYGPPNDMEEYDGGRTYAELSEFAQEHLVPQCSVQNLDLCDADTQKRLEDYRAQSLANLRAMIEAEEIKLQDAKATYEAELEALQAKYNEAAKTRDDAIAAFRDSGIHWMRAIEKEKKGEPNNKPLLETLENYEL